MNKSASAKMDSLSDIPKLYESTEHTAVTRLVPWLEKLSVGSKIPTHVHLVPSLPEVGDDTVTKRYEERFAAAPPAKRPRSRFLRAVLFGVALVAVVIVGGILVKTRLSDRAAAARAVESPAPIGAAVAAPAPERAIELPVSAPPAACRVVGRPKAIAGPALLATGIEIAPSAQGISLAFVTEARRALTALVDPTTLSVAASRAIRSPVAIRRVTPIPTPRRHRPDATVSIDRMGDPIAMRRSSSGPSPIDLGLSGGHLVWAPHGRGDARALWPLAGDSPIEALRAVPFEGPAGGYAVAFRRGGSIWTGFVANKSKYELSPLGPLSETKGLGTQLGALSVAVSGDIALVTWADRASPKEPWGLRYRRWRIPSGESESAATFEVPAGGWGAPYISPAVASLGGGRFLLVWTEGPMSGHRVRAITLGADGRPRGDPLVISEEAENAGQGQAAVMSDGRGIVAYLVASAGGFRVMGTSIACPL